MAGQADSIFEDAVHSAFGPVDEALSRIAMLNSLLAVADRLQVEGVAFKGLTEALYDVEASLAVAVRELEPAFKMTSTYLRYPEPEAGAD